MSLLWWCFCPIRIPAASGLCAESSLTVPHEKPPYPQPSAHTPKQDLLCVRTHTNRFLLVFWQDSRMTETILTNDKSTFLTCLLSSFTLSYLLALSLSPSPSLRTGQLVHQRALRSSVCVNISPAPKATASSHRQMGAMTSLCISQSKCEHVMRCLCVCSWCDFAFSRMCVGLLLLIILVIG